MKYLLYVLFRLRSLAYSTDAIAMTSSNDKPHPIATKRLLLSSFPLLVPEFQSRVSAWRINGSIISTGWLKCGKWGKGWVSYACFT
jgi:hypothetical protein